MGEEVGEGGREKGEGGREKGEGRREKGEHYKRDFGSLSISEEYRIAFGSEQILDVYITQETSEVWRIFNTPLV